LLGNLLILAAALAWGFYTIIGREVSRKMPHIVVSAFSTLAGTVGLIPFATYECWRYGFGPISSQTWLAVLFLGIVASALTFVLYNYALTRLDAGEAGVYVNLAPIVTLAGAALFLGESLSASQLLGGAFVLAGVYLAGRRSLS
jgi:drug/metabolite transporter (DMT)-like permease